MSCNAHNELIDRFERGGELLRQALREVPPDIATTRSAPGTWSILELVVHMQDSDAIAIDRMKRMVSMDHPKLVRAHESAYIERLHPHAQSLEDAVTLFDLGRRQWARVLRQLPDADFQRVGIHSHDGPLSLLDMLNLYVDHLDHHLPFVEGKLKNLKARG